MNERVRDFAQYVLTVLHRRYGEDETELSIEEVELLVQSCCEQFCEAQQEVISIVRIKPEQ